MDALVQQAYVNNPQIEQAVLSMKNNEITIKAEKNGLLPTVDAYAFYGASAVSGSQSQNLNCAALGAFGGSGCPYPAVGYGTAVGNLFNNNAPDKGVGVNMTIPLRNRVAQADQARSQMEYRQAQMRLQQLYTQIRIQVINGQYALTNDRAQVTAAQAAREYAAQSLDAEQKKFKLGASTSALVLQQQRNLATAENTLISATAAYAKDRAGLLQIAVEYAGPVRDQHYGRGDRRDIGSAGDSRADRADGAGGAESDYCGQLNGSTVVMLYSKRTRS